MPRYISDVMNRRGNNEYPGLVSNLKGIHAIFHDNV